jgi:hypothetical protein
MSLLEKLIARMTTALDLHARRDRSGNNSHHNFLAFHPYNRHLSEKADPKVEVDVAIEPVAQLPSLHICSKVASLPL